MQTYQEPVNQSQNAHRKANQVIELDANQGFNVLDAYYRMRTILHVKGTICDDFAESRATIIGTSPKDEEICLRLFDELDGATWLCTLSIANSRFWIDEDLGKAGASDGQRNTSGALLRIQS
jgi:hypothetical protein